MRDQENVVDGIKSHIPSQWASAVSSLQNVAKHYHEAKCGQMLSRSKIMTKSKCITSFFMFMIRGT